MSGWPFLPRQGQVDGFLLVATIAWLILQRKAREVVEEEDFPQLNNESENAVEERMCQFKISYNCQKDKWSLNELISFYVQEKERLNQEKTESDNMVSTSKEKSKKRKYKSGKNEVDKDPTQKKQIKTDTQNKTDTCLLYKKFGHLKNDYAKYHV
ncbi:hypothetical protein OPV22_010222 [Ensete ventricosum]|uniref:Uncharacterized protein n=1 Tax=Ensete ventricosum TaxID=4639 RepID=A0AAV8Q1X1_ENSVE|nr:hypothetical protein OPV22_010222 [Ensete ventricosum]